MRFDDRYALAIRSSNLRSEEKTLHSSTDILGAAGKASMAHPLAMALLRLFCGDNREVATIIDLMTDKAVGKAYRTRAEIDRVAASLIARLVLDWYRSPACRNCGGHGFRLMPNAPKLSDKECGVCEHGRRLFDDMFPENRRDLAQWLAVELEREIGLAGPAAMAALAPRLDL